MTTVDRDEPQPAAGPEQATGGSDEDTFDTS